MQVCSRAVVVAMGVNADGRRELLGLKVGGSESDAHKGLTNAIRRMLQGSCWQRCRVHFARNLLQRVPKAHQGMVTAALRSVFAQEKVAEIEARWDDLASSLAERFPRAAELMIEAREDVLAFHHVPEQHWRKVWSTILLERVNVAPRGALGSAVIKRRTLVVGIFPNDAAITRLVGAVLLEQDEHWPLEGRRMFSAESMAAIAALEELPTQPTLQDATA
jgi:putative transposase